MDNPVLIMRSINVENHIDPTSLLSSFGISASEVIEITREPEIPELNIEKEYLKNTKKKEKISQ